MHRIPDLKKVVATVADQAEQSDVTPEHIRLTSDDLESINQQKVTLEEAGRILEETPGDQAA